MATMLNVRVKDTSNVHINPLQLRKQEDDASIVHISTWKEPCGVARFAEFLANNMGWVSPTTTQQVIPVVGNRSQYINNPNHGRNVIFKIRRDVKEDYARAAEEINQSGAKAVLLQHEFGMYGGERSSYMIETMNKLRKPLITVMHTITRNMTDAEKKVTKTISEKSAALIVMADVAIPMLKNQGISTDRTSVIHHGHDEPVQMERGTAKESLGISGRFVMSNVGFVVRYKGIDLVLDALPELINANPKIMYVVAGQVWQPQTDDYSHAYKKGELEDKAHKNGVQEHVMFINKWLTEHEKRTIYAASDLVMTPYRSVDQISSGTLADTVGARRTGISTRYEYAKEIFGNGRGMFCEPTPESIASTVKIMFDDRIRNECERRVQEYSTHSTWPKTARKYLDVVNNSLLRRA